METRAEKIERYGSAHTVLTDALKEFPREMWQWRPSEGWSIHEIVVHITDSEANSYARCRRFIAEPGTTVMGYDENQWARALDYHSQGTDDAVELFRWLRLLSYRLIKSLPEEVWSHTVTHTESGLMTMDDWLETYTRHIPDHVEQMRNVYAEWQAKAS